MSLERVPKGTKLEFVLQQAKFKKPNAHIGELLGVSPKSIGNKKAVLRNYGLLKRPSAEETKKSLRESHYIATNSVYPMVEQFERMGMSPSEQAEAVRQTRGIKLDEVKVASSGKRARHVEGRSRSQSGKELGAAIRDNRKFPQDTPERVRFWNTAANLLSGIYVESRPSTRSEWLMFAFAARLSEVGVIEYDVRAWLALIRRYQINGREIPHRWPTVALDAEKEFILEETSRELNSLKYPSDLGVVIKCINEIDLSLEESKALLVYYAFMDVEGYEPIKNVACRLGIPEKQVKDDIDFVLNNLEKAFEELEERLQRSKDNRQRVLLNSFN